jgi:hypothetical protein
MAKQFLCKVIGHDYDISIIGDVGGSLRVVADQCTRCGHTTRSLRPEAIIQAIRPANDKYGRIHTDGSRSGGQPVLKPCPFCGEQCADLIIDQGDKWAHYSASCLEVRTGYNISDDAPWRDEAIAAWNTRQPTHRNLVVAAAPADRIGGGGGLPCGVVGVDTQSDVLAKCLAALDALGFEIREKNDD